MTLILITALVIIQGVSLLLLSRGHNGISYPLRLLLITNMISILLVGSKLISIGGYVTNIGTVFYATVAIISLIILRARGSSALFRVVSTVYYAVVAAATSFHLISLLPILEGNEIARNIDVVANMSLSLQAGAFTAFATSQLALWWSARMFKTDNFLSFMAIIAFTQLVDSLIFFPMAFYHMDISQMWHIGVVGFVYKMIISIALYPFYRKALSIYKF